MTEKERLIDLLKQIPKNAYRALYAYEDYDEFADYLLDHGVRIPVRCEECKHGESATICKLEVNYCTFHDKYSGKNDYCVCGERRAEDG